MIKKIYGGVCSNYGILLMTPAYEDGGFIILISHLLDVLETARIELAINPAVMNQ